MSDIPEPEISPAFTLEDIRKIRDWNYARRQGMTPQEICEDIRKGEERYFALRKPAAPALAAEVNRVLEEARKRRKSTQGE